MPVSLPCSTSCVLLTHLYLAHDLFDREKPQAFPGGDVDPDAVADVRPSSFGPLLFGFPTHVDAGLPGFPLVDPLRLFPKVFRLGNPVKHLWVTAPTEDRPLQIPQFAEIPPSLKRSSMEPLIPTSTASTQRNRWLSSLHGLVAPPCAACQCIALSARDCSCP